jgi:hypothetical protein
MYGEREWRNFQNLNPIAWRSGGGDKIMTSEFDRSERSKYEHSLSYFHEQALLDWGLKIPGRFEKR